VWQEESLLYNELTVAANKLQNSERHLSNPIMNRYSNDNEAPEMYKCTCSLPAS